MKRIVTLDIETGIDGGENPFGPNPDVVAVGWHCSEHGSHQTYDEHQYHRGTLKRLLHGTKVLVTFNGKFDIQHLIAWPEDYAAWQDWVAAGGVMWDCQLAQYLLMGMTPDSHYLSLNEVSEMYGGEQKIDAIKELWEQGVQTRDIDRDMLIEYLQGDVKNTRLIFEKQLALARERGQLKSLLLNFGALCCVIEMERNGLHVDVELGEKLREELLTETAQLAVELNAAVPESVRGVFNWGSRFHKSALLFGGTIKVPGTEYRKKDGSYTTTPPPEIGSTDELLEYDYFSKTDEVWVMEDGAFAALKDFPEPPEGVAVFKSGKNEGQPKKSKVVYPDITRPKTRKCDIPHTLPGHTKPLKEWASSPAGVYKVGEEVMEVLKSSNIPFVKSLVRYTAAMKDLGTYFYTEAEDGSRKGMLTKVGLDGLIHHTLNMVAVVTGRLSCSDPNMQNLPRKDKSKAKKLFRSRFGPGGMIFQSDFSSLEVYVQAMLTGAKALIALLLSGRDIHVHNLARAVKLSEGKTYEELLLLCKGTATEKPDPKWKEKRVGAKEISFQDAYGAGDAKIAITTGLPEEDVKAFRDAHAAENPEIGAFFDKLGEVLIANRTPGSATPHPEAPGVMCHLGKSHYVTPDGKRYGFEERPAPAWLVEKGITQSFSPTERKNYVVQGTGGEIAKAAMWLAVREFYRRRNFNGLALLINQVHDALYGDAAKEVALEATRLLHACMLAASEFFGKWFKWDLPIGVPAETTYGEDLSDENPVDIGDVSALVAEIVSRNLKGNT
jgi:DNA polymerase-1